MKIRCDVCDKAEASLFCPADEAALCHSCDRTVHHANKLATKHTRFTLHHPSSKDTPRCDICQERRAYLFCQEDRAILCRECDLPIHRANEQTRRHNRFLLTGVKLSGSCLDPPASSSTDRVLVNNNASDDAQRCSRSKVNNSRKRSVSAEFENASSSFCMVEDNMGASDTGSVSTSSISEYLIETIPGFCFEDLLDASFAPNGFCKNNDQCWAFQDQDLDLIQLATSSLPQTRSQFQVEVIQSPELSHSIVSHISSVVGVKEITKMNTVQELFSNQLFVEICWKLKCPLSVFYRFLYNLGFSF